MRSIDGTLIEFFLINDPSMDQFLNFVFHRWNEKYVDGTLFYLEDESSYDQTEAGFQFNRLENPPVLALDFLNNFPAQRSEPVPSMERIFLKMKYSCAAAHLEHRGLLHRF